MDMAPSKSVLEINTQCQIYSVLFADNGGQVVLGGGNTGELRRWQVDNGHEVDKPIRTGNAGIYAVALSPDHKWLVCGLESQGGGGLGVWNAQTCEKSLDVKGHTSSVISVDILRDSSRFATGSCDKTAMIWDLATGQKLVGPLQHEGFVMTVRFSPNGDRFVTGAMNSSTLRIYDSSNGQQLLTIPFSIHSHNYLSSPLAWSTDGCQLFAVSFGEVKRFDTSSGSVLSQWTVPGSPTTASIVVSCHSNFAIVVTAQSVSCWDVSTTKQLGDTMQHTSMIYSIALSPSDDHIATGEINGKVTLRSLHGIIPDSYFGVNSQLPFVSINDTILNSWTQGDLNRVEELLTRDIGRSPHDAHALAQRALVRARLKRWGEAIDDAEMSTGIEKSVIGYIAKAIASAGNGEHKTAFGMFDLVFRHNRPGETDLLLLTKAIVMFECGEHEDAISRVGQLITVVNDKSLYNTIQAKMFTLLASILLREGAAQRAIELLRRAQDAIPVQLAPFLTVVSLIFGWDFDELDLAIQTQLQECVKPIADLGDMAVQSGELEEAIRHYSSSLSLDRSNPVGLLVKRCKVYSMLMMWEDALTDAKEAVNADPAGVWGYEMKYMALHALRRYDDAFEAFNHMFSLIESSTNEGACQELGTKYVSPSVMMNSIENAIQGVLDKISPPVLINVESGLLCDRSQRRQSFMSGTKFKELLCSLTEKSDEEDIARVVEKHFEYVMLSQVLEGQEPSLQDLNSAGSIWQLDSSSTLNAKLQKFCEMVRADGYRWAWTDTVCVDKAVSIVLNQSLRMKHLWYEASAATFVYLMDVDSSLAIASLKYSKWLTLATTPEALLFSKAIRFYTRNWKPYRGDTRDNHKESYEILQELADAIEIPSDIIISFNPDDLTDREKLRLASTRRASAEDVAYSFIGIFKSNVEPNYGEGYAALGHLLEEIVTRSGEVTVLDWTGKPSQYNSCFPASCAVYSRPPGALPLIESAETDSRVAELWSSLSQTDVIEFRHRITSLPPARFTNRRLHLPCISFPVHRLGVQNLGHGRESRYRAQVLGIGDVVFSTLDKLSVDEPHKFVFINPWIRDLCEPPEQFTWGDDEDTGGPQDAESAPNPTIDDSDSQAVRLVARLQQPFHTLLLQQQAGGGFRRVAAEHEIYLPGIQRRTNLSRDVGTTTLELL